MIGTRNCNNMLGFIKNHQNKQKQTIVKPLFYCEKLIKLTQRQMNVKPTQKQKINQTKTKQTIPRAITAYTATQKIKTISIFPLTKGKITQAINKVPCQLHVFQFIILPYKSKTNKQNLCNDKNKKQSSQSQK